MNLLKIFHSAIIAIIGILLAIFVHAGNLKNTILAPEDFCYTDLSARFSCTIPNVSLLIVNCSQAERYTFKPIFSLSSIGRIPVLDGPSYCPGGDVFCCAELQVTPSPICIGQPSFNIDGTGNQYYRISAIHCKPV